MSILLVLAVAAGFRRHRSAPALVTAVLGMALTVWTMKFSFHILSSIGALLLLAAGAYNAMKTRMIPRN
jgi:hypothetical protein